MHPSRNAKLMWRWIGLSLLAIALIALPACQKAKLGTAGPNRSGQDFRPEQDTRQRPERPSTTPPSRQQQDDDDGDDIDTPDTRHRGPRVDPEVPSVENPVPREEPGSTVTRYVRPPERRPPRRNDRPPVVTWWNSGKRNQDVLRRCNGRDIPCEEDKGPKGPPVANQIPVERRPPVANQVPVERRPPEANQVPVERRPPEANQVPVERRPPEANERPVQTPPPVYVPPAPVATPPPPPLPPSMCSPLQFRQPERPLLSKIDILFIVDTSNSLDEERLNMVRQIQAMVDQLPVNDYNIGVMAAHSPDSGYRTSGFLFSSGADDPRVLKSAGSGAMTSHQMKVLLEQKLLKLEKMRDRSDAQGEVGMYSLYRALTELQNFDELKDAGLLRDDAAFMPIFVADENDVCHVYKPGEVPGNPKGSTQRDKHEVAAFDKYCVGTGRNGENITPQLLWDALLEVKGLDPQKLILSGIMYTEPGNIPPAQDQYHQENEIGRGYLDLIVEKGQGHAIELGRGDFAPIMDYLGRMTSFRLQFTSMFDIPQEHIHLIDPSSIEVSVYDAADSAMENPFQPQGLEYKLIRESDGSLRGVVRLSEEEVEDIMKPASIVKIEYRLLEQDCH